MAFSNSLKALEEKSSFCHITQEVFVKNTFTEILSLTTSLALKCRLWKDAYKKKSIPYETKHVGLKLYPDGKTEKIKLARVASLFAHANGYWFCEPLEKHEEKLGTSAGSYIGFKVPYEIAPEVRAAKTVLSALEKLPSSASKSSAYSFLEDMVDSSEQDADLEDRVFIVSLDLFACGVCELIDVCHVCAGEKGFIDLDSNLQPIEETAQIPQQFNAIYSGKDDKKGKYEVLLITSDDDITLNQFAEKSAPDGYELASLNLC